jgi:hypothetical protein
MSYREFYFTSSINVGQNDCQLSIDINLPINANLKSIYASAVVKDTATQKSNFDLLVVGISLALAQRVLELTQANINLGTDIYESYESLTLSSNAGFIEKTFQPIKFLAEKDVFTYTLQISIVIFSKVTPVNINDVYGCIIFEFE